MCRELQTIIFSLRPTDSVVEQTEPSFKLGDTKSISSVISFLKIVALMKSKLDLEEREGYTQEDHNTWSLTVDSICSLIEMGLPAGMGMFSDKITKPGGKEPRNKNSKIASYFQHLKLTRPDVHTEYTNKIQKAISDRKGAPYLEGESREAREVALSVYLRGRV